MLARSLRTIAHAWINLTVAGVTAGAIVDTALVAPIGSAVLAVTLLLAPAAGVLVLAERSGSRRSSRSPRMATDG
jgi:hypothetical protein